MPVTSFICPRTQLILRGEHALLGLPQILDQHGWQRVFVFSTPSLEKNGLLRKLQETLGERCVGVFAQAAAHTPLACVEAAVDSLRDSQVDAVISLGGSSVVDLAKSTLLTLAEGTDYERMKIGYSPETGPIVPPLPAAKLPHVAVPTTLSASEFTFATVITDPGSGEKVLYADPKLAPAVVIQDPSLTAQTPETLWLTSGVKILCDCIENLCSPRANATTNALAIGALKLLFKNLPESRDAKDLAAREACFEACYMALGFSMNAGIGMVAALRHQLGGHQGVAHGEGSAIVLPEVLRYNLPNIGNGLGWIGEAISGDNGEVSGEEVVNRIEAFLKGLGIPGRLRDVGVDRSALDDIAQLAAGEFAMAANPRPADVEQTRKVLEAAW